MIHYVAGALMRLTISRALLFIFFGLMCDQVTKFWVLWLAAAGHIPVIITDYFQLVLVWNRGISFGILNATSSTWVHHMLTLCAACLSLILLGMLFQKKWRMQRVQLSCIIAGAIGNLIDRLYRGSVVDFLDFHFRAYHWPAFNVADALITVGAVLILWQSMRETMHTGKNS